MNLKDFMEINSVLIAIFGVGVFGFCNKVFNFVKKKSEEREARQELRDTSEKEYRDSVDKRLDALEYAQLASLHDKLYSKCSWYIDQGQITVDDLDNLEYLFRSYSNLGGNGTGETLYKRVKELKIVGGKNNG